MRSHAGSCSLIRVKTEELWPVPRQQNHIAHYGARRASKPLTIDGNPRPAGWGRTIACAPGSDRGQHVHAAVRWARRTCTGAGAGRRRARAVQRGRVHHPATRRPAGLLSVGGRPPRGEVASLAGRSGRVSPGSRSITGSRRWSERTTATRPTWRSSPRGSPTRRCSHYCWTACQVSRPRTGNRRLRRWPIWIHRRGRSSGRRCYRARWLGPSSNWPIEAEARS